MDSPSGKEVQERIRVRLHVIGTVQGVGFRPFVYRLAVRLGIGGSIRNRTGDVIIEAEGTREQIHALMCQLRDESQPPIRVEQVLETRLPLMHELSFIIEASLETGAAMAGFPADIAVCRACLQDMGDSHSRYFLYPFTSCASCGPRYTIVQALPYDRGLTSLAPFPLCEYCQLEYEDPSNRRFHAQTIGCLRCGPVVECRGSDGTIIPGDAIPAAALALKKGGIAAIKGLGGFHLLCDAAQEQAIYSLRNRKHRPMKPLALMARDIADVEELFDLSEEERQAITAPEAPIVLLTPKARASQLLPLQVIAPGLKRIGVLLAYTPLHKLILSEGSGWAVATSGNVSGQPIIYRNEEAIIRLQGIADLFLLHNRDIVVPIDDSVGHVVDQQFQLLRRARGYVPVPLQVPLPSELQNRPHPAVIGGGAEMKNAVCFIHHGTAYMSQHLGDMDTDEALEAHRQARGHLLQLLGIKPEITAYDPHPHYAVSQEAIKSNLPYKYPVLHHHAHMAACMAENELDAPVIGCILDGSGYGADGSIWGFEVLTGDYVEFRRVRSLRPFMLPGGEAAIRNPWMIGASLIYEATADFHAVEQFINEQYPRQCDRLPFVHALLTERFPSVRVSSAGRLFDGVSAILGLCGKSTYEGEAALKLSELADSFTDQAGNEAEGAADAYPFHVVNDRWDALPAIRELMLDIERRLLPLDIVRKFHHTVAAMVIEGVRSAAERSELRTVVLSGGVWNNRYLLSAVKRRLLREGFSVYTHRVVPSGDGGIALGQAVCALWRWSREHVLIGANEGD